MTQPMDRVWALNEFPAPCQGLPERRKGIPAFQNHGEIDVLGLAPGLDAVGVDPQTHHP